MTLRLTACTLMAALLPLTPLMLASTAVQAQPLLVAASGAAYIRGLHVEPVPRLAPGVDLRFDLVGAPGGNATLRINGAARKLQLTETDSGRYVGSYTIGARDRITSSSSVTADLTVGKHTATERLNGSLQRDGAQAPNSARYCSNCATVEAVNVVEAPSGGNSNLLGTAGGAVVGGLLGNQVGGGSGRKLATVAGAVGGALVGRNVQGNMQKEQRYEVVVRYSGSKATQTLQYENDPGFRVGEAVRVNNGVLSRDQ